MNGRLYDPTLGRFFSADPIVQAPYNLQSYNRYSYVLNNPLSLTDPSGFSWWTKWRRPLLGIAIGFLTQNWTYSFMTDGGALVLAPHVLEGAQAMSAIAGGFAAGGIAGGNMESAITGAMSAGLFNMAGSFGASGSLERVAAHAVAGCVGQGVAGGSCGSGAISAGFAEFIGPTANFKSDVANFATRVVVGGTASRLAGDQFANGAVTAAFAYLFNHCSHGDCTSFGEQFAYDYMFGYKGGTLIYNLTLGDGTWTGWELLDAASIGLGIVGRGLQLLSPASRLSSLGYDANKLNHIFGNGDHMMGPLVQQAGSTERAMLSIDNAAQSLLANQAALQRGTWIDVQGFQVWVRGVVIESRVRIGSASMNAGR